MDPGMWIAEVPILSDALLMPFKSCACDFDSDCDVVMFSVKELNYWRYHWTVDGSWCLLLIVAKKKFSVDSTSAVSVVLEEDGTSVDEEEYFQHGLESHSVLMLLKSHETWTGIRHIGSY